MKNTPLSDADIESWIDNEEALWFWWRYSGQPIEEFIKANRDDLIRVIKQIRGDDER